MRWMMMLALVGLIGCSQKIDTSSPEFRAAVLEIGCSQKIDTSSPEFRAAVLDALSEASRVYVQSFNAKSVTVSDPETVMRMHLTPAFGLQIEASDRGSNNNWYNLVRLGLMGDVKRGADKRMYPMGLAYGGDGFDHVDKVVSIRDGTR